MHEGSGLGPMQQSSSNSECVGITATTRLPRLDIPKMLRALRIMAQRNLAVTPRSKFTVSGEFGGLSSCKCCLGFRRGLRFRVLCFSLFRLLRPLGSYKVSGVRFPCDALNRGALIIRIGFGGPLYYNYNKEPQKAPIVPITPSFLRCGTSPVVASKLA